MTIYSGVFDAEGKTQALYRSDIYPPTIESDPTKLGSNVPDGDIEFTLASIWDARSIAFAARGPTT